MNIPDAAVEAAARAAYEDGFLRHAEHYYPLTWEEIGDGARESWRAIVRAVAPHIAAQALRDAADIWQINGWTGDGSVLGPSRPQQILGMAQRACDFLRARADRIEAGR